MRTTLLILSCLSASASIFAAEENYGQWSALREITLNTSPAGAGVAVDQIGFPVLISLTSQQADVFAQANATGADLRFSSAAGAHLPYQIESWDRTAQKASIWVRVDTVKGGSAVQRVRLHWGKAGAADSSNGKAVFQAADGFKGVWHLGSTLEDATANGNNGTDSGTASAPDGRIGAARYFENPDPYVTTGKYIALGNPAGLNLAGRITFEAWVKWLKRDGHRIIICHGAAAGSDLETVLRVGETKDYRTGVWTNASHYATLVAPAADSNAWVHLAGVYSGSAWILYRNGLKVSETPADTNGAKPSPGAWRIGAEFASPPGSPTRSVTRYFHGWLDEVRVSNVARSAEWIKLAYENQKDAQTLVTVGQTVTALAAPQSRAAMRSQSPPVLRSGELLFRVPSRKKRGYSASGADRRIP
ncbi:MAG: hypothetical protein JWO30_891 [Fibrobacteres bacterium]|nr:hypothetical protein [Fibrobacterota bacterium]